IWNNKRYKRLLTKKTLVNEDTLEKNKASVESFYDERFGSKEFRENIRFYTVPAEKNIENEDIKILYSKGKQ
ncbi:cell division protein, partial [Enterococcus faecium]|nr:cell division protein [Enterococcus faecium]